MAFEALAKPGRIGNVEIRNRIVVPPINNNYTHAARMSGRSVDCYISKAKGGAGLIIVEATSVDYPQSRSVMNPALDRDEYMDGFRRIAEGCHEYGAKVFVQLTHVGRQTKKSASGMDPVAPSPIKGNSPLYPDPPKVLETEDILRIEKKFGEAALRAKECGMDGVEIHMGHGYLVNNFLSPLSNQRGDEYGGLKGGIRFACEIVREVHRVCGEDFPVSCRLNGDDFVTKNGNTIVEYQLVAQELEKAGADALNVTGGMRDSELNFNDHTCGTPHGAWLHLAERIKRCVNIPVIAVKRLTPVQAEEAVARGAVDFVAFAKQSVADPDFARKILENRLEDMIPCISCSQGCYDRLWMWVPITCAFNPRAGKSVEELRRHDLIRGFRRILVVGGGPSGCTAAAELARLGHYVTLAEKSGSLGGKYARAAATARKAEAGQVIAFWERELKKYNVNLLLNTPVTEELLKRERFDAVVNATGADFVKPAVQGEGPSVLTPEEALDRQEELGEFVVIAACSYGCAWTCRPVHNEIPDDIVGTKTNETHACTAGFAAVDLAEELARLGKKVVILTERQELTAGMGFTNKNYMQKRFFTNNISVSCGVKVKARVPGGLLCEKDGVEFRIAADSFVTSSKLKTDEDVKTLLSGCGATYYQTGDADAVGNVLEAVHGAYELAARISLELLRG